MTNTMSDTDRNGAALFLLPFARPKILGLLMVSADLSHYTTEKSFEYLENILWSVLQKEE